MKLVVDRGAKSPEAVRQHPLFGTAVFVECGLHEPESLCYDHHSMGEGEEYSLSVAGMIHQDMLKRRKMPDTVVMNHIRHLDNLVALYLLTYRRMAQSPDTTTLVSAAD